VSIPLSNWVKPEMRFLDDPNLMLTLRIYPRASHGQPIDGSLLVTYTNGKYEGEVKDGQPHGKGVFVFPDGNRYEGTFRNGGQHGRGKFTWPDGDTYDGEWKNAKRTGHGMSVKANGDWCEGEWRDDKLVGTGKGVQGGIHKPCYPKGSNPALRGLAVGHGFTFGPGGA
jgi:hypothetical protein